MYKSLDVIMRFGRLFPDRQEIIDVFFLASSNIGRLSSMGAGIILVASMAKENKDFRNLAESIIADAEEITIIAADADINNYDDGDAD